MEFKAQVFLTLVFIGIVGIITSLLHINLDNYTIVGIGIITLTILILLNLGN